MVRVADSWWFSWRQESILPTEPRKTARSESCRHNSGWGLVDDAVKQFLQIFIIGLQTAHDDVVHLREFEECLGGPTRRHLDAVLAPSIVVENLYTFKAQFVEKAVRFALNVQAVTVVPTLTKLLDGALAQGCALGAR